MKVGMKEILIVLASLGTLYLLMSTIITIIAYHNSAKKKYNLNIFPSVSILKPLKGIDDNLIENLRSFFKIDYPDYEIIFGVVEAEDPAINVVNKLQAEYPYIKTRLVVSDFHVGINPKVNNLYNIYRPASKEFIVISDSNIIVSSDYLRTLMGYSQNEGVGLVTSTIHGLGAKTPGSILENLHLNTYIAASAITITNVFKIPVTIGKSMCINRTVLERIGGFESFADFLLEDGLIGQAIKDLGLKIVVTTESVKNINVNWGIKQFLNRHYRWALMRRHLNLWQYISEIISNPICTSWLLFVLFPQYLTLIIAAGISATKIIIDCSLLISGKTETKFVHLPLIVIKDILLGFIWILPFFCRTVIWRGNRFIVSKKILSRL